MKLAMHPGAFVMNSGAEARIDGASLAQAGMARRLSLGTVQFGVDYGIANSNGKVPSQDVARILRRAWEAGLHTLDTAAAYGSSETVLGETGISHWLVTTKLSAVPESVTDVHDWVRQQVLASLTRLRLTKVHGLLLHRPDQVLGNRGGELINALRRLQQDGLISKIGVSVYSPLQLDPLMSKVDFDLVQIPCSILDRRLVRSGWAQRLKEAGVEVHTRSAFLQGLLLMAEGQRPAKFNRWNAIWARWSDWLERHDLTPVQACLLHALSIPEVDKVVIGVDGPSHLEEILSIQIRDLPPVPEWPDNLSEDLLDPSRWSTL